MTTATWVVGGTGQLGSALLRRIGQQDRAALVQPRIRWDDTTASIRDLADGLDRWLSIRGADRLRLFWAAGAAITSTDRRQTDAEVAVFEQFTRLLGDALARRREDLPVSVFFASSAGGLYSGSRQPAPFDEGTEASPVTPYGHGKLAMERALASIATGSTRVLIGRISTLYGPGQRIGKAQGFITQLCRSYIVRQPLGVYVPLDTIRDYVHSDDAARIVMSAMDRLESPASERAVVVKNIASHTPTTLGEVIHQARLVFKRAPNLVLASSALAGGQVRDLRISSNVWTELGDLPRRPLVVGIASLRADLESQMRAGAL